ncbi:unnamed protein product [Haemonchus placei]|uniref:G_PROTEIN_RECEP_F1_2 domain-containing protein n=1 Tax=Haemonchus placei TaxID=6290 RepID=A0A0N4W938_HAEPC|nr:unnamed protein product [Haemonchus placei]
MWCFNQTYISAILRCFGVLVISFQRYISLCKSVNPTMQLINTSYRWILPVAQWTVPTLYSIPILIFSNATFKAPDNLEVLIEHKDITNDPIFTMRTIFPVISCFFSYVNIWMMLILNEDIRRKLLALIRRDVYKHVRLYEGDIHWQCSTILAAFADCSEASNLYRT